MIKEIWKPIEGYPDYEVSSMGRVKSLNYNRTGKEKILKSSKNKGCYSQVNLCKDGLVKRFLIHRLVAQAFIPNPNNLPVVNHKNEIKDDNRVENLEWCSPQYNTNYGTTQIRRVEKKKIRILQFTEQGELVKKWDSAKDVERELGFYQGNICMCCKGKLKTTGGFKWCYHYKSLWLKNHIPQIKLKKVA